MIKVCVNDECRDACDVDALWLAQQIERRRDAGIRVWVRVEIDMDGLCMALATPDCPSSGSSRPPTPEERKVFAMWEALALNTHRFSVDALLRFLRHFGVCAA